MKEKNSNTWRLSKRRLLVFSLFILSALLFTTFSLAYTIGPNYRNISVDTRVNITNAGPEILNITISEGANIVLTAGSAHIVECNVSVRDYNSWNDIDTVNATFHASGMDIDSPLDNNTIYFNSSCTRFQQDGFYANYSCSFPVLYYANPGTWNCSVAVNDSYTYVANNHTNTNVNTLLALNLTTLIDYGEMIIAETSQNKTANVTNFGNVPINVSVYGYGATAGDGLAMVCDVGTILIANEKYSANIADDFAAKVSLSSTSAQIADLTIPKQSDPATQMINTTYWQLYIPPNPFGACNGTVVFQAESST